MLGGKVGVLVNFIILKLKSKNLLSLSQFSLMTGFFEGTRENILHIFHLWFESSLGLFGRSRKKLRKFKFLFSSPKQKCSTNWEVSAISQIFLRRTWFFSAAWHLRQMSSKIQMFTVVSGSTFFKSLGLKECLFRNVLYFTKQTWRQQQLPDYDSNTYVAR